MRIVLIVWLFGIANLTKAQGNSDFKNIDRLSVNVFKMSDGSELTILSDTVEMTSKIQLNGKLQEAELKFVIPPDSTTQAYSFSTKLGEVIVLESYIWQATGLSASIVNLTFLLIQDRRVIGTEFSNSFFKGVDSIKLMDGSMSVTIFKFMRYSDDNAPICCVFDFEINESFQFKRKGVSSCKEYESNKDLTKEECTCPALIKPIVFTIGG